MKQQP